MTARARRRPGFGGRIPIHLTLLTTSLLVAISGGELALRMERLDLSLELTHFLTSEIGERDFFILTGRTDLPYRLAPGAEKEFYKAIIRTNAQGYLGEDLSVASPEPRIAIVGDSVSFGMGVQPHETFGAQLGRRLGARVATIAAPGYDTVAEVNALEEAIGEHRYKPDIIILQFGPNDNLTCDRIVDDGRSYLFYAMHPLFEDHVASGSLLAHSRIIFLLKKLWKRQSGDELRGKAARLRIEDTLGRLAKIAKTNGFEVVFADVPYNLRLLRAAAKAFTSNETSLQILAAINVPFHPAALSHVVSLHGVIPSEGKYWRDSMHPSALGHRLIATELEPVVRRILEARNRTDFDRGRSGPP